jgi:hypothetical protein
VEGFSLALQFWSDLPSNNEIQPVSALFVFVTEQERKNASIAISVSCFMIKKLKSKSLMQNVFVWLC